MQWSLVHIGARPGAGDGFEELIQVYLRRMSSYVRCESTSFRTVESFNDWLARQQGRTQPLLVLLDSRGKQMSSEAFATWLGERRDQGTQQVVFAIGPADGWDPTMLRRAQLTLSFGPMTLAHALARLVLAEQLYRACTILAGHPYHTGH